MSMTTFLFICMAVAWVASLSIMPDQAGGELTWKQRAMKWLLIYGGWGLGWAALFDDDRFPAWFWGTIITWGLVKWLGGGDDKKPATATADVNEDVAELEKLREPFDPEQYIDLKKGIFLGLSGFEREPKYVPAHVFSGAHASILGISGTGKSSFVGVLLSQLAGAGEGVIVFDPKPDQMLPRVLMRSAQRYGVPFNFINLNTPTPQINPFLGCTSAEADDLLQSALGLGETGNAAVDYHRGRDREATGYLADAMADGQTSIPEIIGLAQQDERVLAQENLWRGLQGLGRVKAACAPQGAGPDLREVIGRGGVLYVAGSSTDLKIASVQKMILQRCMQILQTRQDDSRPVALFLDELKYLLSPGALRAASQIRSYNAHCLFAYQSLEDLNDCPGLDAKAVFGAIYGNSNIKFVYKVPDIKSAREFESASGKVRAQEVTESTSDNGETKTESKQRRWVEVPKFKEHVFTHLPRPRKGHPDAAVGVVFGVDSTAFICATRWLKAGDETPQIAPVSVPAPTQEPQEPEQIAAVPDAENTVSADDESMAEAQYSDEV